MKPVDIRLTAIPYNFLLLALFLRKDSRENQENAERPKANTTRRRVANHTHKKHWPLVWYTLKFEV